MAKTYRNLWPKVISWDNLLRAYRKCRRRKRYRQPATSFEFAWESNLLHLQRDLIDQSYQLGDYYHFHISDPKPRKISAAPFRDRVVHHAVVSVLEPIFEPRFIFDSYACRAGKGTHRAIRRAQYFQRRYAYCLKTDIVKFFPSVDHEILLKILRKRIADEKLMRLIEAIIYSGIDIHREDTPRHFFRGDDLFSLLRPKGLPIGNLTSQFFANVYLDPIDHFIKEQLQLKGYVRYADDLLLFANCKKLLWNTLDALENRLAAIRLKLHPDKTNIYCCDRFMPFLGVRCGRNSLRISQQGIHRFIRRTTKAKYLFRLNALDLTRVRTSLISWNAHWQFVNSDTIRDRLVKQHCRFRQTRQT